MTYDIQENEILNSVYLHLFFALQTSKIIPLIHANAFTQPITHEQDVTQIQFLSEVKLLCILSFPFKLVAKSRLKYSV